jgi:hypothetical protein
MSAVRKEIVRGRLPSYREQFSIPPNTNAVLFLACYIAHAWGDRLPTAEQLCAHLGMSRSNAYRWLAAMREVRAMVKAREGTS